MHCMDRMRKSSYATQNHVTLLTLSSTTISCLVTSEDRAEIIYKVDLKNGSAMPSCTCKDFSLHRWPCKHMFAAFNCIEELSWEKLPDFYINHPLIVLDEDCYTGKTHKMPHNSTGIGPKPITRIVRKRVTAKRQCKNRGTECRSVLNRLINLTYEIKSENLTNILTKLKELEKEAETLLENTLLPMPVQSQETSNAKSSTTSKLSYLPKRVKRKLSWTKRVGSWVSIKKKARQVNVTSSPQEPGKFFFI